MLKYIPKRKIVLAGGDALLVIVAFNISYAIRQMELVNVFYRFKDASFLSLFIFVFVFYIADIYSFEVRHYSVTYLIKLAVAVIVGNCMIAAAFYLFQPLMFSRIVFLLNFVFIFSFLASWRFVFYWLSKFKEKPVRIIMIGAGWAGRELYNIVEGNKDYEIVGFLDDNEKKRGPFVGTSKVIGDTSNLVSLMKDLHVDEVIVTITHGTTPVLFKRIMNAKFDGLQICDMPAFYERITGKIPIFHLSDSWLGYADFYGIKKNAYNAMKRSLDNIFAIFGIITSFPLVLVSIIAIKIESKGPVFFKQERVGENSKTFEVLKLRTMVCGKEDKMFQSGLKNDPRVTRVGSLLRFFRIDEITQLWNVLKGDMSIIGPRSLMKEEVDDFAKDIPYFFLRHSVKPGLTGWAQVNYKHGKEIEDATEKLQYDLYYIKNLSPILDFHILLKTVKVVLFGRGAR